MMLDKVDDALTAFKKAKTLSGGKDQDILNKLKDVQKIKKERAFAEAIEGDNDMAK